jgi:hypothetical protein
MPEWSAVCGWGRRAHLEQNTLLRIALWMTWSTAKQQTFFLFMLVYKIKKNVVPVIKRFAKCVHYSRQATEMEP